MILCLRLGEGLAKTFSFLARDERKRGKKKYCVGTAQWLPVLSKVEEQASKAIGLLFVKMLVSELM